MPAATPPTTTIFMMGIPVLVDDGLDGTRRVV
jgi:hypothetical protein